MVWLVVLLLVVLVALFVDGVATNRLFDEIHNLRVELCMTTHRAVYCRQLRGG